VGIVPLGSLVEILFPLFLRIAIFEPYFTAWAWPAGWKGYHGSPGSLLLSALQASLFKAKTSTNPQLLT
jgi:hypothetical protein